MNIKRSIFKSIISLVMLMVLPMSVTIADLLPEIPKAKAGTKCVEDPKLMRTNHYEFLLHQRNDTMRKGIRTPKHSLKGCINCHVTKDEKGEYPSISSEKHFCKSCHNYAAVTIDCFQCHATKPDAASPHN
jgi:hypothetical protein